MSLLIKGLEKLSQLEIDADKDWATKGITNIKEIAAAMAKGDMAVHGGLIIQRLQPSGVGLVLTSAGALKLPVWMPGAALEYWIPVTIDLSHAQAIVEAAKSHNENAPIASSHVQAYGDAPADMIKRLTPAILCPDAQAIVAAAQSHNENAPVASEGGVWVTPAVGGAKLDDGGAFTDYTTEINSVGADDVHLLPTTVAGLSVGDAFYFGLGQKWDQLWLNIGVAAEGNFALAHEYWDGDSWELLPDLVDNTSEFTIAGLNNMKWTRPGDWALKDVDGVNLYWIRARVAAVVGYTTQPLGTQGWCEVIV